MLVSQSTMFYSTFSMYETHRIIIFFRFSTILNNLRVYLEENINKNKQCCMCVICQCIVVTVVVKVYHHRQTTVEYLPMNDFCLTQTACAMPLTTLPLRNQ